MKKVILVSILFALFLFACNPDETPTPTPPETEQPIVEAQVVEEPTDTPVPTATLQPISPLVVSAVPEQGQEQPRDAPVEISFDQPMDIDSVEKAFAIEPGASVDGSFEWSDDNLAPGRSERSPLHRHDSYSRAGHSIRPQQARREWHRQGAGQRRT